MKPSYSWDDFEEFEEIKKVLSPHGEGETMATQAATAVSELAYRWFTDRDVFDNRYGLRGERNDLSSYANWLYNHIREMRPILDRIKTITNASQYKELLYDAAKTVDEMIPELKEIPRIDSVYDEKGPFEFSISDDEGEEDDEECGAFRAWAFWIF